MKKNVLPVKDKILPDVILLGVLSAACMMLPFATYRYKKADHGLSGFSFFSENIVNDGASVIPGTGIVKALVAAMILAVLTALIFPKIKKVKIGGYLLAIAGIMQLVLSVFFINQSEFILADVKKPGIGYGVVLEAVLGVVLVARAFHILYQNKVLSPLDFMVLPGCIYLLINNYFPLFGIFIAFKKIDYSVGILNSPWVGLENFKYLFSSSDAWVMTRNTLLYNLAFIIFGNILAITVGIMLNELFSKTLQKFFQTSILLPQLISIIIVSYIVYAFLSNEAGLINKTFLAGKEINFYNTPVYWPFILVFIHLWKSVGYNAIIYLSAIVGINKSLYEAANVDGCSKWKQIRYITLPLLKPTVITLCILSVGRIFFSDFGLFYQVPMNSGALFPVTQTIDTYVYRGLLQLNNISMSSAANVYQSVVGFIVVITANMIVRRIDSENAMF